MDRLPRYCLVLLLVTSACRPSPDGERRRKLDEEVASFVFKKPKALVRSELVRLLAEDGYTLAPDADATDGKPSAYDSRHQYLVRFIDLSRGGFLLQLIEISEHADHTRDRTRRGDLEWALIERAEPDRAVDMMAVASKRGDEAHSRWF